MWKTTVTLALFICVQVCAHDPLYPRIVGGADAQKKDWPWIVSLHNPTCHFCGGSLISKQWVLSAAHCFSSVTADSVLVYLGKMTQRGENKNEKMITVQRIYTHNRFNSTTGNNDIALLNLTSPVEFNDHISPVCLTAHGSDFLPGTRSQIIGWGDIAEGVNLPYPGILQEAEVFVVDTVLCRNQLTISTCRKQVTNNTICAGVHGGGVGTFHGDSGGPMMSQHCSKWVQSGITSWGIGCASPNRPNVFTRVSQYQQWINDTIRDHQDLPQFVNVNLPCPTGPRARGGILRWCCCLGGEE